MIDFLDDLKQKLIKHQELIKASLDAKSIPSLPSSADMGNSKKNSNKMKTLDHMNGVNVEQYNYEGQKTVHDRAKGVVDLGKEEAPEPDMASPDRPKGLENKRQPVTHDECGRPFARTEVLKVDANGQWNIEKSNYGPKGWGLYDPNKSTKRKASRTGEELKDVGRNKGVREYTTPGSTAQSAREDAAFREHRAKEKEGVKVFSDEEKKELENKMRREGRIK